MLFEAHYWNIHLNQHMDQVDLVRVDMEVVLDPVLLDMEFAVLKNLAQVDIHFVQDKVDKGLD